MARAPERIKHSLSYAHQRRIDLHAEMVRGEVTLDEYRDLLATEDRHIDRLLAELSRALA